MAKAEGPAPSFTFPSIDGGSYDTAQWRGVNLCQISRITLFWDRAAGTTRAVGE